MNLRPALAILLLSVTFTRGFCENIDSLITILNATKNDTAKVSLGIHIGDLLEFSDPDSAISWYYLAIGYGETAIKKKVCPAIIENHIRLIQARAFSYIGLVQKRLGKKEEAFRSLKKSLILCRDVLKTGDTSLTSLALSGESGALDYIGMVYDDAGNAEKAETFYIRSIKIKEKTGDEKGLAASYNNLGIIYENIGEYEKAIESYLKSFTYFEAVGDSFGIGNLNNNIGLIYKNKGDHALAMEYFNKNLKIYDALGRSADPEITKKSRYFLAFTLGNIGIIHYNLKNFDKAIANYTEAGIIFSEMNDPRGLAFCYNNVGNTYLDMKQFDKAEEYFSQSLEMKIAAGDKRGMASGYNNMGLLNEMKGNFTEALRYYKLSLELKEETGHKSGIAQTLRNIASLYISLNKYDTAIEYAEKSLAICDEIDQAEDRANAYQVLSEAWEGKGDKGKALEMFKIFKALQDSLFTAEKNMQIVEMETKYESEKKEKEITVLKQDQEIKDLALNKQELEIRSGKLKIALLIGAIILVVILFLFIYYRYRQRQKRILHEKLLEEKKQRMKAIIDTQENERSRIAKDLHDGIGQLLSAASMNFSRLAGGLAEKNPEEKPAYDHSIKILNEASAELRNISHQMMPKALKEAGVIPAISDLLEKSLSKTGIKHSFETFGIDGRLQEKQEVGLYRICQELTGNIIRHAGASEVNVQLYRAGNNIILFVEDNGCGITLDGAKDGVGLRNIASRAEALNGSFKIEKGPEKGTVATIKIPA